MFGRTGSYGRNDQGDVAMLSQHLGRPVRLQYMCTRAFAGIRFQGVRVMVGRPARAVRFIQRSRELIAAARTGMTH
jgi:hypothetical protein